VGFGWRGLLWSLLVMRGLESRRKCWRLCCVPGLGRQMVELLLGCPSRICFSVEQVGSMRLLDVVSELSR
jgi:hypothetical protein